MNTKQRHKIKKELKMKRCAYCYTTKNLTIDHKIAECNGGTDELKNLQCLCYDCNIIKSGLSHKEVLRYARWIDDINSKRKLVGKSSLGCRKKYKKNFIHRAYKSIISLV